MMVVRRRMTHIVDTPASMADESVSAVERISFAPMPTAVYSQHCNPMRKAKSMTGAVYCPSTLYAGWVSGFVAEWASYNNCGKK